MLFNTDEYEETYRYFCRCGTPTHILQITGYIDEQGGKLQQVGIEFYPERGCDSVSFWRRLKRAIKYIFGIEPEPWNDFILRKEDLEEITSLLERTKEHQCTM